MTKAGFVGHCCTRHGVLQADDCPTVAFATFGVTNMLAVVLDQGLQLAAAGVQNTCEIQGNIGRVVGIGVAEFV